MTICRLLAVTATCKNVREMSSEMDDVNFNGAREAHRQNKRGFVQ